MPESTGSTSKRRFLCQIRQCPMEDECIPLDDKQGYRQAMERVFGDDYRVVDCGKVRDRQDRKLCCEMLIETETLPVREKCPDGFNILMEVEV